MIKSKLLELEMKVKKRQSSILNPIISDILDWFVVFFDVFFRENTHNKVFKKGDIYLVDLGINIGSELNKRRPCIIYSSHEINRGDCIVVFPLKTRKDNGVRKFSVVIDVDQTGLDVKSYINITDIRSVSKKRISKHIGKVSEKDMLVIDKKVMKFFVKQKGTI